jgi:hypothetical protein
VHILDLIINNADSFHASSVFFNTTNRCKLWTVLNKVLHRTISNSLPTCPIIALLSPTPSLILFSSKIHNIHTIIFCLMYLELLIYIAFIPPKYDFLIPASLHEISKPIGESNYIYLRREDAIRIPFSLLKEGKFAVLPTITQHHQSFSCFWCFS